MSAPRGIRNRNPLNIRDANQGFLGEAGADEQGFLIFRTDFHGIRAAARILRTYQSRGIDTLEAIIASWAPPSENATRAYVTHASLVTGLAPDERVEPARWPDLLAVMIRHENGAQPYEMAAIERAVQAAI